MIINNITKKEIEEFLRGIRFKGSRHCIDYFSDKQVMKDIYEDILSGEVSIRDEKDLVMEIENKIIRQVSNPETDIYFSFNYLDSRFDGENEKDLEKADKIWGKKAKYD